MFRQTDLKVSVPFGHRLQQSSLSSPILQNSSKSNLSLASPRGSSTLLLCLYLCLRLWNSLCEGGRHLGAALDYYCRWTAGIDSGDLSACMGSYCTSQKPRWVSASEPREPASKRHRIAQSRRPPGTCASCRSIRGPPLRWLGSPYAHTLRTEVTEITLMTETKTNKQTHTTQNRAQLLYICFEKFPN